MACTLLTTANVTEGVFDNLTILHLDSLTPIDGIARMMSEVGSEQIALTSADWPKEKLKKLHDELAGRQEAEAEWIPLIPNSFADFVVRELGGQIASVWVDLLASGIVIASREEWERSFQSHRTIHESLVALSWKEAPGEQVLLDQINWEESHEEWPVLEPKNSRYPSRELETCLNAASDWLPEELDRNSPDFTALLAGFHQWYDALEYSHQFSQAAQFSGTHHAGDYWHAIMHRREPDYSNSKYWFGNVGSHPIDATLEQYAGYLEQKHGIPLTPWSHRQMVDFCSRVPPGTLEEQAARQYQAVEMVLLMKQTSLDARP